jgi:hypothetical protein
MQQERTILSGEHRDSGIYPMKQQLVRIDQVAGKMNVWLVAVAIGLGMLDFTILLTKAILAAMPVTPVN